jgi:hypothetical protein
MGEHSFFSFWLMIIRVTKHARSPALGGAFDSGFRILMVEISIPGPPDTLANSTQDSKNRFDHRPWRLDPKRQAGSPLWTQRRNSSRQSFPDQPQSSLCLPPSAAALASGIAAIGSGCHFETPALNIHRWSRAASSSPGAGCAGSLQWHGGVSYGFKFSASRW